MQGMKQRCLLCDSPENAAATLQGCNRSQHFPHTLIVNQLLYSPALLLLHLSAAQAHLETPSQLLPVTDD